MIRHPCVLFTNKSLNRAVVILNQLPRSMQGRLRTPAFFRPENGNFDPTRFYHSMALDVAIGPTCFSAPRTFGTGKRPMEAVAKTPVAAVHLSDLEAAILAESSLTRTASDTTRGFGTPDPIETYAEYQRETYLLNIATRANCVPDASVAAWSQAVRDKLAVVSPKKAFKSSPRRTPIVLTYSEEDD